MNSFETLKEKIDLAIESKMTLFGASTTLHTACCYALKNGGKRLRPIIVFLVAQSLKSREEIVDAALAVEYFHTASLIADDLPCMDNESQRRGAPALHRAFSETVALLASYALIAAGYELLQKNNQDPLRLTKALGCATYNTGITGATGGQFLDLHAPALDEMSLREIVQKKTSSLFELSFVCGWLFGGGDLKDLDLVKRMASHFGLAFQIADDFADLAQDEAKKRAINFPLILGKKRAAHILHFELASFCQIKNTLNLSLPEFDQLIHFLYTKAPASS